MRTLIGISIFIAIVSLLASCQKQEQKKVDMAQTDAMYTELLTTYKAYADSLSALSEADTSGRLNRLIDNFEHKMLEINKRYPPELDYNLTQLQNDSLYRYFRIYLEARSRLKRPTHIVIETDSLAADSVDIDIR